MYDKQGIQIQIGKVLRWKVKQSSHTRMAVPNTLGDKIQKFAIEKAQKPYCFKNVKLLSCRSKKKELDGWSIVEWVRGLDRKFASDLRSVTLVINNYPAHSRIKNLKSSKKKNLLNLQIPRRQRSLWIKAS